MFPYTADDLVALRHARPTGSLYGAVLYSEPQRFALFTDALTEYRRLARTLPVDELIEELLGYANIFKINDDELIMMREMFSIPEGNDEEACKWFMDRFDLEYTILTGGATFSTIIAKDGETSTLLTPHVEVADTVGAGDSFSGSFTGKILSGASLKEAHRAAVNTAAYVCTKEGGWPAYPTEGVPDYLAAAAK